MMNPFYFNINNTDLVIVMTKMALFNISASLSNVWLNRREPDRYSSLSVFVLITTHHAASGKLHRTFERDYR